MQPKNISRRPPRQEVPASRKRIFLDGTIAIRFGKKVAFCAVSGIARARLSMLIGGWENPTLAERKKISELLGADAAWLFEGVFEIKPLAVAS